MAADPAAEALRDKLDGALTRRWAGCLVDSYHAGGQSSRNTSNRQLAQRMLPGMGLYDAYFEGDHQLAFATSAYWEAFGPFLGATADNYMPLVVKSRTQRLRVQGIRYGKATGADAETWDIWQANDMDASSGQVHRDAIKLGVAYWLVDPPKKRGDPPLITPEHPVQTIVQCSAGNPRVREAALKKWRDEAGDVYANLYTATHVYKWRRPSSGSVALPAGSKAGDWVFDEAGSGEHSLGEVPIVPVANEPDMFGRGQSDLAPVIEDQTNINKMLADMMLGSEYQAFPQRVLLGVEQMVDANGNALTADQAQLAMTRNRILRFSSGDAKIDQWDAVDLKNYVEARNHLLDGMFSKAQLPVNYNARGQMSNLSADALRAAEKNLLACVDDKLPYLDAGHEDTMRLAHKSMGNDDKAREMNAEVIWRNPESRTEAELTDAATKKQALGIPLEILLEDLGYSPQKIDRVKALQMVDGVFGEPTPPPDAQQNGNGTVPAAA